MRIVEGSRRQLPILLVLGLLVLTAGCRQVLYSQLGEQEANEMLAVLARSNIDARKVLNDKHWGIDVARSELPVAVQVLSYEGLPRGRYTSLAELFKRDSIVSTPTEERVRFIHGISQEISKTLSLIDGVIAARVHIVLPQNDPLADRSKPSSASVFIRHRPDADLQRELTAIRSLVVRSVEGLTHERVFVSLFTSDHANSSVSASIRPQATPDRTGWGQGSFLTQATAVAFAGLLLAAVLAAAGWLIKPHRLWRYLTSRLERRGAEPTAEQR